MRLSHKVDSWRDSTWCKKPTALAGLTMIVGGQRMLMARSILVDVNHHRPVLVDVGRHRLKMVVGETMGASRAVTERNGGGRSNDAEGIKDSEQTRCLLPLSIGQKSSHYFTTPAPKHPIKQQ